MAVPINAAVPAAAGYNFSLLLRLFEEFARPIDDYSSQPFAATLAFFG